MVSRRLRPQYIRPATIAYACYRLLSRDQSSSLASVLACIDRTSAHHQLVLAFCPNSSSVLVPRSIRTSVPAKVIGSLFQNCPDAGGEVSKSITSPQFLHHFAHVYYVTAGGEDSYLWWPHIRINCMLPDHVHICSGPPCVSPAACSTYHSALRIEPESRSVHHVNDVALTMYCARSTLDHTNPTSRPPRRVIQLGSEFTSSLQCKVNPDFHLLIHSVPLIR